MDEFPKTLQERVVIYDGAMRQIGPRTRPKGGFDFAWAPCQTIPSQFEQNPGTE